MVSNPATKPNGADDPVLKALLSENPGGVSIDFRAMVRLSPNLHALLKHVRDQYERHCFGQLHHKQVWITLWVKMKLEKKINSTQTFDLLMKTPKREPHSEWFRPAGVENDAASGILYVYRFIGS